MPSWGCGMATHINLVPVRLAALHVKILARLPVNSQTVEPVFEVISRSLSCEDFSASPVIRRTIPGFST